MIINEEEKKEEKNEKLLVGLCECYLLFYSRVPSSEFLSICVPCLLKAALKKEESEKAQKEVEMALLALSNIYMWTNVPKELYLSEIKEVIQYHQEHHNLTHLAYQSVWAFFTDRMFFEKSLEEVGVNELHLVREAVRELEELTKNVIWMREKKDERGKETNEELLLIRWFMTMKIYLRHCQLQNEEFVGLFNSIVQMFRAAKDNFRKISNECMYIFLVAKGNLSIEIEDLLNGGVVDVALEEMQQPTLGKKKDEKEEAKRKATKRKVLEKMEEKGYEDDIFCFNEILDILNEVNFYDEALSLDISDYFVNV
eukprot:MONOS_7727.1-p1 / transcript=MONOS_7727.1 / gene=MONOS_7727 / organism=Monocercomonoides_exilis_PA203 / gene_product=unspecified product / transcript_product=unspecified product / location=Mono_scaffold00271:73206-74285(+) / protein_length=312 / sequence_SO=supercontig / SO=protein_coding / is_pseudo=false